MLAKHPDVVTTNEESPLAHVATLVDLTQPVDRLTDAGSQRLQREFWDKARSVVGDIGERLLVDKMPLNIEHLDLAACLFPDAKVVLSMRDPRDVCLSCFMQHFAHTSALANFVSLEDTAWVYDRLMSLWQRQKEILPLSWMEFRYEDLIQDMEGTLKPVLDFMGLAWVKEIHDYRDMDFQNKVITPSYRQIGEPLHGRASGRWERYRRHLSPILNTLEPYVRLYGYERAG